MLTPIETFILYNVIIILSCIIAWNGEKRNNKAIILVAYLILLFVSVFRYDIGNDYENFYNNAVRLLPTDVLSGLERIIEDFKIGAIMVPVITGLVPNVNYGPILVIGIFSFFFLFFVYLVLDRCHSHTLGIFLLFILLFVFKSWDWIKQGVAVSIFLFSVRCIIERKFLKFLILILFASLWHISALVTLISYPLSKIKISPRKLAYTLIGLFVLTEVGVFKGLYEIIVSSVPYYSDVYEMTKYSEQDSYDFATTKTFFLSSLWYIVLLWLTPSRSLGGDRTIQTCSILIFMGAFFYMVSSGSLLLDRLSFYFLIVQLILVPIVYHIHFDKKNFKLRILYLMFAFHYLIFNNYIFLEGGLQGSNKYETIFSDNYEHHRFRYRPYEFFSD